MDKSNINIITNPLGEVQKTDEKKPLIEGVLTNIKPKRTDQFVQYPKQDTSGTEEFTYQKKARFNVKKGTKLFLSVLSIFLIATPFVFFLLKYNSFFVKKTEQKGEIVWWNLGDNEAVLLKRIDEYTKMNPNVKIKLIKQSEIDYRERLINSLKDNKGPDVFTIHNSWVPMFVDYLDMVPEGVYSIDDFSRTFYPVMAKDLGTSGGIVGIPLEYDALTLFINEDMFSFSGKTLPDTWDEFKKIAIELTIRGNNGVLLQSGVSMGLTENVDYWPEILALLMLQNKSNLASPTTRGVYEAMAVFKEYAVSDKVWDTTLPDSITAFAEGKVVMCFAPSRATGTISKLNPNLNYRTVEIPQVRKDDPIEPDVSYSTYYVQSVWKKSGDKELAWDFLKYLSSKDVLEKINQDLVAVGSPKKAYPRVEMRNSLINDKILGSVVALAPISSSWYLADKTNDGIDGINSKVNEAYEIAIKSVNVKNKERVADNDPLLKTLSSNLKKVLVGFNVFN